MKKTNIRFAERLKELREAAGVSMAELARAIEVKSSSTYQPKYFTTLDTLGTLLNVPEQNREIVYSGSETFETKHGKVTSFKDCC